MRWTICSQEICFETAIIATFFGAGKVGAGGPSREVYYTWEARMLPPVLKPSVAEGMGIRHLGYQGFECWAQSGHRVQSLGRCKLYPDSDWVFVELLWGSSGPVTPRTPHVDIMGRA